MLIIANWKNNVPRSEKNNQPAIFSYLHKLRNRRLIIAPPVFYTSEIANILEGTFSLGIFSYLTSIFLLAYTVSIFLISLFMRTAIYIGALELLENKSFLHGDLLPAIFLSPLIAIFFLLIILRRYYIFSFRKISLAGQDIGSTEEKLTGSSHPKDFRSLGIKYCLIGHPEREEHLSEPRDIVHKKIRQAVRAGATPILCSNDIWIDEDIAFLKTVSADIIVAYEPTIAIKSGIPSSVSDIIKFINKVKSSVEKSKVVYGGGVSERNIRSLCCDGLDGFLIGRASLDLKKIKKILKETEC